MVKHTIEISSQPYHLSIRESRLQLQANGTVSSSIPCDEICMVVVDHAQTTYTHKALETLAHAGAVVVICGADHLPISVLLQIADHSELVWRLRDQINCTVPKRKRFWQQIVKAKIRSQALNLPADYPAYQKLMDLSRMVASGDSTNIEAQAAKIYWQNWLWHEEFRRDYDGGGLNAFLNYGYAVLSAAVARSIVAAGLTPMLGLYHHNRANPFCLADDLMEPLRALVDDRVREMHRMGYESLNQPAKAELLGVLTQNIEIEGTTSPLMVGVGKYVSSLVQCYSKNQSVLSIPMPCT